MYRLDISKSAQRFLNSLPQKQSSQLAEKILLLSEDLDSIPSRALKWYFPYRRIASWEYRIIYRLDWDIISILLIWKRNDASIYKIMRRKMR